MCKKLVPDCIFPSFDALTVGFLKEKGITALVLDVDNTLIPYEETLPNEKVLAWLKTLRDGGISVALVSNNHQERLEKFNANLGYPAFYHGCKPFPRKMKSAIRAMGADPAHTANLGDQLFTDVLAGRLAKTAYSFIVPPIKDKKDIITRIKRFFERPYIKRYYKKQKEEET